MNQPAWCAAGVALAVGATAAVTRRLRVDGPSMRPTLEPGDRVVALRGAPCRPGDLVAVRDPRLPSRLLVKRAVRREGGAWLVLGDNPAESTDSRTFGPVPRRLVVGRVIYRYAPPDQAGWLGRRRPDEPVPSALTWRSNASTSC